MDFLKNNDIITDDNKFDFYFIVIENLSKYDFSEFIICCGWSFCNDYSDFGAILEGYRKTSFAQHFVIEYLQECVYESLLDDIENILDNETDTFICTSCEEVAEEMEIFLEKIKDTYPFLKEDEIDSIRENVDLKSIVDRNFKFFESAKNSSCEKKEQEDIKNVDALFSGLL